VLVENTVTYNKLLYTSQ